MRYAEITSMETLLKTKSIRPYAWQNQKSVGVDNIPSGIRKLNIEWRAAELYDYFKHLWADNHPNDWEDGIIISSTKDAIDVILNITGLLPSYVLSIKCGILYSVAYLHISSISSLMRNNVLTN